MRVLRMQFRRLSQDGRGLHLARAPVRCTRACVVNLIDSSVYPLFPRRLQPSTLVACFFSRSSSSRIASSQQFCLFSVRGFAFSAQGVLVRADLFPASPDSRRWLSEPTILRASQHVTADNRNRVRGGCA